MIQSRQSHLTLLRWVLLLLVPWSFHGAYAQSATKVGPPEDSDYSVILVVGVCSFTFMGIFLAFICHCFDTEITGENPITVSCSCRGIAPEVLGTFPILIYSTIKDHKIGKGALECAVCLSEFKDCETLRLLPKCNHVFHPDCIDAWLASHVTCPVCRAKLRPDCEEVATVIPAELNAHQVLEESSLSRTELGEAEQHPEGQRNGNRGASDIHGSAGKQRQTSKSKILSNLVRSNSTGHSLVERGKDMERYTLRLPEEVRKHILVNHEGLRRSASYDVIFPREWSSRRVYKGDCEGSSKCWEQIRTMF
ncbi:hypothetical protein L6164_006094 [Bauhinia variegata]|uniref:Uncharacterized protein n=1 Tax=Bauhinia variegata TaxID=167791 RepID=A0ACB9PUT0_BAUVA|nr:hypothetical protein L6164_006094 [Bauhinia variegata]